MNQKVKEDKGPSDGLQSGWNEGGSWWKLLVTVVMSTRMIRNSDRVEEEWQRKSLKAEVDSLQRRRKFELKDVSLLESGGLSRKRLTYAGVRVGDPANTEGMNESGREPGVQRKSRKKAKVKIRNAKG
ncbi:hypothetical protein K438DRAFT_1755967 [Mycena galopus ATCC 62051]|nr:hypothetical protein K438DRAFT_1755967 [Mycena galopus ATCC 62051]